MDAGVQGAAAAEPLRPLRRLARHRPVGHRDGALEQQHRRGLPGRAGYALVPELAALFYTDFAYSDKTDERIRTDFYQVRNDLFIENRIRRFQDWASTPRPGAAAAERGPGGGRRRAALPGPDRRRLQPAPARVRVAVGRRPDRHLPAVRLGQPLERQPVVLDRVLRRQRRELPRDAAGRPGADEQGVRRRHHQARLPHLSHRLLDDEHVPGLLELRADELLRLVGPAQPELDGDAPPSTRRWRATSRC